MKNNIFWNTVFFLDLAGLLAFAILINDRWPRLIHLFSDGLLICCGVIVFILSIAFVITNILFRRDHDRRGKWINGSYYEDFWSDQ